MIWKLYLYLYYFLYSYSFANVDFVSTYDQWQSRSNNFIEYIDDKDQARVIFVGSESSSADGNGKRTTVSEGMGYGLLLAYAYDDQDSFW